MNALPWTYIREVCNATRMLQICNLYIRRFLQYRDVIVHDYIPALNTSITANEHGSPNEPWHGSQCETDRNWEA